VSNALGSPGGVRPLHRLKKSEINLKRPYFWSLASGVAWSVVASAIAYALSTVNSTPLDAVTTFAGGIVAAPVIGLLVGYLARRFSDLSHLQRFGVALADLYFATYLFLLATSVGQFVRAWVARGAVETPLRLFVVDPLLGTLFGLTYTGFVVVLLPLSYVNHLLIGKAWNTGLDRAGRQTG